MTTTATVTTASQRNRPGDRRLVPASPPTTSGHASAAGSGGASKLSSRPIATSGLVTGSAGSNGPDAPVNAQGVEKPLAHDAEKDCAGGRGRAP